MDKSEINQEYWIESLMDFADDAHNEGRIVIVEISLEDLESENEEGISIKNKVKYADWVALSDILSKEELKAVKRDCLEYESEFDDKEEKPNNFTWIVLYSEGEYITQLAAY